MSVDPVTLSVLAGAFAAICNEVALVIGKTAYSPAVNEGKDFSGSLYDAAGGQVAQGEFDLPGFVGLTQSTVPEIIKHIGTDAMQPGDIYMVNDPYTCTTHCNDVHLVRPVFLSGRRIAFLSSTAHWSDVGGSAPGSINCYARDCYEEGIRVPPIVLSRGGEYDESVLAILWANMRSSWEREGDLKAQAAALHVGESRVLALVDKYGLDTVQLGMAEVQAYSERMLKSYISDLSDGVYHAEDRVDQDPRTGEPKTVRVTFTVAGDHATFDLSHSDDKAASGINSTRPATLSGICIGIKSMFPDIPMNIGIRRAVEIVMRSGSIVCAERPSAVSGLAATSLECVIACTQSVLGQAAPQRACGIPYSILNVVHAGHDPRPGFDDYFVNYVWSFGGLGACADHDGPSVQASPYSASTQHIPWELEERRFPILWLENGLLTDSGGPGKYRGGLGSGQVMGFPYAEASLGCVGNRERFGPPGVSGGKPGRTAGLVIREGDVLKRNIGVFAVNEPVQRGHTAEFKSAGGGGYGDPLERVPQAVLEDVIDDYVSVEGARKDYGVIIRVVDERKLLYEIDWDGTAATRKRMR